MRHLFYLSLALLFAGILTLLSCSGPPVYTQAQRRAVDQNANFVLWCNPQTMRIDIERPGNGVIDWVLEDELDGQPCMPSNDDTPVSGMISHPITNASGGASAQLRAHGSASASMPAFVLQEIYPTLLPLPFQPTFLPSDLANYTPGCVPNTYVYLVGHLANIVNKISTCPLANVKTIPVCANPLQVKITPDASTAVVSCYGGAIAFIDTATDNVTTISTPNYTPNGVEISPDGSTAYFTCYNNTPALIFTVNLATRQLNPQTLAVNAFPKSIFLTPDGSQAWLLFYQSSQITVIDTRSMSPVAQVNAGGQADTGMAFTPDGTRAYVAVQGGSVSVFNTATFSMVSSIAVSPQPSAIAISQDSLTAYVASFSSANPLASVIDIPTNSVVGTSAQPGPTMGLVLFH